MIESPRAAECAQQQQVLKQLMTASCEHVRHLAELLYTKLVIFHPFAPLTEMDIACLFPEDSTTMLGSDDFATRDHLFRTDPEVAAWCVVADLLFPTS